MRVHGEALPALKTKETQFGGQTVTIQALPVTFMRRLGEIFPMPEPPQTFARDRDGKFVLGEDRSAIAIYNERDSKYLAKRAENADLRAAAMIREALKADENVTWDAQESAFKSPAEFYRAVYDELCGPGVTLGELIRLGNEINVLSGLTQEELGQARADFS